MFFTANDALYVTDGTAENTHKVGNTDGLAPKGLTAMDGKLLFAASGKLWVADENQATGFDPAPPSPVGIEVKVLASEGDDRVTPGDWNAPTAANSQKIDIGSAVTRVDLTAEVKDALARGDTRLTVRVENTTNRNIAIELAGAGRNGRTGLEIVPAAQGLVADLYTHEGKLVASGKSIIDMRNLKAGGYYLHVHRPEGAPNTKVDFAIAIDPPARPWTHPLTDRDRIHGGDGEDRLIGNESVDRLYGESGRDAFLGETIEVHDAEVGERVTAPNSAELSYIAPLATDALIGIADPQLRVAIAEALDYPVTTSYLGTPLIHVPGGGERTDLPLFYASRLAELPSLDASGRSISDLTGLKYAINLTTLNLADNKLTTVDELIPGTSTSDDTKGFSIGMRQLENLAIDLNPIANLLALQEMGSLRRLSFDGSHSQDVIIKVAVLTWPERAVANAGWIFSAWTMSAHLAEPSTI